MIADRALSAAAALVFATSAVLAAAWCGSMSSMPGMQMPGGWTMSMTWMRMPAQGWAAHAVMFLAMWTVMMVAMMMPALAPMLARYRLASRAPRKAALTLVVASGYFAVWMLLGAVLCALGVLLAEWAMRVPAVSRAVPMAGALVVLAAGASQFTPWKSRRLAGCREPADRGAAASNYRATWRHGLELGWRCVYCCAPLTAVLLVIGVMDLRAMAVVTMAISAERLMPPGSRTPRLVGVAILVLGACMCVAALPA